MNNLSQDDLRQRVSMMDGMSDEQLRQAARQAGQFNPAMANVDPTMLRQASQMMKNMSPEQLAQMQRMATGMMGAGQGAGAGMPPGMA